MTFTSRSRGTPSTPVMVTPSAVRSATSPSSRKTTRFVWASTAATSEARKLSPSPRPTMRGTFRRAPPPRPARLAAVHDRHRVGAIGPAQRGPDGRGEVARVGFLDQVRQRLGVGLRRQAVSTRGEAVAQLLEVLDDAAVEDRDVPAAVDV